MKFHREIERFKQGVDGHLELLITLLEDLASMKKKDEVNNWWISFIEASVDDFLASNGFDLFVVPDDYTTTETPPNRFFFFFLSSFSE